MTKKNRTCLRQAGSILILFCLLNLLSCTKKKYRASIIEKVAFISLLCQKTDEDDKQ